MSERPGGEFPAGGVVDEQGNDDPEQARRQDEQGHDLGEHLLGVLLPGVVQEERLPGVLEHRNHQHHEDAELVAGLVEPERIGVGQGQDDGAIDDLDHDRRQAGRADRAGRSAASAAAASAATASTAAARISGSRARKVTADAIRLATKMASMPMRNLMKNRRFNPRLSRILTSLMAANFFAFLSRRRLAKGISARVSKNRMKMT